MADGQVLRIPELLLQIFEGLDRQNLFRVSLVCRAWHNIVIDKIWADLPDAWPLLRLVTDPDETTVCIIRFCS